MEGKDTTLFSSVSASYNKNKLTGKRRCSLIDKDTAILKRLRTEDSEFFSDLPNEPDNTCRTKQHLPHHLISLVYRLELSVLCAFRKFVYKQKYPSLSLEFGSSEMEKFINIILRYKKKSVHIQIENVDKHYVDNCISYTKLFTREKERRHFFINDYFDSFVKHIISKLERPLNSIEYLVIYTNSRLGLTEENEFKKSRSWSFYPFKFERIDIKECQILTDFLFTNNSEEGRVFYRFFQDVKTREEFLKRLVFSPASQKVVEEKKLCRKEIKEAFLNKLVFAVNQPNREELSSFIKSEIQNSEVQIDYMTLQEQVLQDLEKPKNDVPEIMYEFYLLMLFSHDMFLRKNMLSINFEGKTKDISTGISIDYKGRTTFIKTQNAVSNIGFGQLFPSNRENDKFSINKHFALFAEGLKDVRYFVIHTNADLDINEEKVLKKGRTKAFYPFKFHNVDIQKKKYKILRDCSSINENGLYQFLQDDKTRISSMLKLPSSVQKEKEEGKLSDEDIKEIKGEFLNKLVLAVNQPSREKLNSIIKNNITDKVPYSYEELHEIVLRWSESHDSSPITKEIMEKLLGDIKNNRSSYKEIQNKNIVAEIKFVKSVVGREGTPTFHHFLEFLIRGEGRKYLEVLKRNNIHLTSVSSILNKAGNNATNAFKDLYFLWFDAEGNKKHYLKTLEKQRINLTNMSSILNGAGANATKAFQELYNLWFDEQGNKTQYLKTLEQEGVNLASISSVLNGTGSNAATTFKDLYNLWFDKRGNKTQYLKTLETEGVNLARMSSVLNGAGSNSVKAFEELYHLWFDELGNKTRYLTTLEKEGVSLASMSSILSGAGINAAKAFEELYYLWFDVKGNKKQCLKTLKKEGISLANMSSILSRTAANAARAFKDLYDLWFDASGNKTHQVKTLEEEGINLTNISSILHGAASNAAKAFKDLYNIWFDVEGNKKQYLKHFIKKRKRRKSFTIHNLSSILNGSGANVKEAFEKLHSSCFNNKGKISPVLNDFYKADFEPSNLSCILCGAGIRASLILKRFHGTCFADQGEKTKLLNDFYKAGFRPADLCNILMGAVDCLKEFHDFCFTRGTKKYLNHFLNEERSFTIGNLSDILHGARTNICLALKDFHDVCFDEAGNKTRILTDFYKAGFKSDDLSTILSMSGNNAALVLRNFHKSCFNKQNYLDHFLAEESFTPRYLSRILRGVGLSICNIFEKLHDLCFDNSGNRTDYLYRLFKNKPSNKMFDVLYDRVRKAPTFVNYTVVEESEVEYDDEEGSQDKSSKKQKVHR